MRGWSKVRIGDVCRVIPGYAFKSRDWSESGLPVVKIKNIKADCTVDLSEVDCVPESVITSRLEKFKLQDGDILLAMTGATAGKVGKLKTGRPVYLNQRVAKIAPFAVHAGFIWAVVSSKRYQELFFKLADGAAQPNMSGGQIEGVEFLLPPTDEQSRIASILSAYDDLIENNTRRIAIVEEMARRIYEEWFVRFRFPGHEQVKTVESELGLIPEGWSIQALGTLLEHHIGGGWGEEAESEGFPVAAYVIRGTDIPDVRTSALGRSPLRYHKESNFRTRKLRPKDIVFEVSGGSKDQPVGRAVLLPQKLFQAADQPIICASFCRLVRANQKVILPELLQLHFERIYDNREIMKYQTQSTGITNFKFTVFLEKEMVLVPPSDLQEHFALLVLPHYELASNLGVKNANLRATRDLLLPKLISGELDVSTLPEPEEAVAA